MLAFKWIALVSLVLQNSSLALLMRLSLLTPSADGMFLASTAVVVTEVVKLIISLLFLFFVDADKNYSRFLNILQNEVFTGYKDWINLTIPSILYTLQNSLQYVSMSQLSAPVFQLLYQMKIVTTAVFSVLMLSKKISFVQWISIFSLTLGVALVQLSQNSSEDNKSSSIVGFVAVLCGCVTSGFAGVYFEMILKSSGTSLWVRNIQLSTIGIVMGIISCVSRNHNEISQYGFFVGYNNLVWGVIMLQAAGGILVALVVKFADNVLKVFATSLSILVSSFISWQIIKDFELTTSFMIGSLIVLGSVFLFSSSPPPNFSVTTGNPSSKV